jgi:hypothetical protein
MCMFRPTIILLTLLFVCPARGAQDVPLLEQLRVDREAMISAEQDLRRHRKQGDLGPTETREYAAYVERLRQRVVRDCMALAAAEIMVSAERGCSEQPAATVRPADIDQQAEQTDAERAAALDAELDADLGEYDQRLLREQERVKAARPRSAGGGGQGGAGSAAEGGEGTEGGRSGDLADNGDPGATGESRENGDLAAPPPASGAAGGEAGGAGHQAAVKDQPKDIPDGSGDDIVARQLREAAERETDPELKRKLWEEYRKYKQGTH